MFTFSFIVCSLSLASTMDEQPTNCKGIQRSKWVRFAQRLALCPFRVLVGGIGHHPGALPGRAHVTLTEPTSSHTNCLTAKRALTPISQVYAACCVGQGLYTL